jgi:hypothetical protein
MLILMAVPSAGLAGTLLPDDQGIVSETSIDETQGAIRLIGGIEPAHIQFDIIDAISLEPADFAMTESVRARNILSSKASGAKIKRFGLSGGDDTSTRNGFEIHDFRFEGATRAVPEPTSLSLLALAGIGYLARFLRRHRIYLLKT